MNITVATLIYKSTAYLDFVMSSLFEHHSTKHDVQYLIVCNDAIEEVVEHAEWYAKSGVHKVKTVDHRNGNPDDWWIQNVYNAWNRCLIECDTEAICFVNSDMAFTDGWLDNLAKHDLDRFIPTSRLVESERMPSLAGLISKNFEQTLASFKKNEFETFAKEVSENGVTEGVGAYMPSLFKMDTLYRAGGWRKNWNNIPGDRITFDILARQGLKRVMVRDSIAYHFQRGESAEVGDL
jgi:hypothetical protein